jgi:crotonobetainyl-CoA:carnitine CoA-transferase CaiB-like acyl-CoA transferase
MRTFDPAASGPLADVRVLDLSRLVCGNVLTMMLGDFGADVVKVESPHGGDPLRAWESGGAPLYWKVYGRNKRSLVLDLAGPAGHDVLLRLADKADVLVESFRPGTLERWGIGPDTLHARNPGLVIARVSGFGQTGPYRNRPGYGTLIEAMSGFAAKNGFPDREPLLPNLPLADMVAGVFGAYAVQVALHASRNGAPGQVVDLALMEPLVSILGIDPALFALNGERPQRTGNGGKTAAPRNVYRTGDGRYLAISAPMQSMTERVFDTIGRPELKTDARFRTNTDRMKHVGELDAIIGAWTGSRPQAEALAIFEAAGVTASAIYEVDQLVADPHVQEREVLVSMADRDLGSVLMQNIAPRLSGTPGTMRHPAPAPGEHSRAVLTEAGFPQGEIEALLRTGIVSTVADTKVA